MPILEKHCGQMADKSGITDDGPFNYLKVNEHTEVEMRPRRLADN